MKKQPVALALYGALFEISLLLDEVNELDAADAAPVVARLRQLESEALRLLDRVEMRRDVAAH